MLVSLLTEVFGSIVEEDRKKRRKKYVKMAFVRKDSRLSA